MALVSIGFGGRQQVGQIFRRYVDHLTVFIADHGQTSLDVTPHGLQAATANGFGNGRPSQNQGVYVNHLFSVHGRTPSTSAAG